MSVDESPADLPRTGLPAPYVGLRPFEREERGIYFGRTQDGQFLCDKIFSERVVIFYARSGLGKSSLLRALVIPQLEENDAFVVYFDAWSGEDPTAALKEKLIGLATEIGVPSAAAGAPTLAELLRLLKSIEERTFILVLDQFEEFLLNHGDSLDPLKKELGAVIRNVAIDVHVVITLREEFLASLEPFRQSILDLGRSTYRLESLDDNAVRDAILRPAELFGASYEPDLTNALIRDLCGKASTDRYAAIATQVDLPMLQLVCHALWAAARRESRYDLTCELYERLGGAERILDDYVHAAMPKRWRDKKLTARLMRFLAPPSGLKMSYSAEDLVAATGLKRDRVQRELERLSQSRILRAREDRAGARYELQHDVLVSFVSPWRDAILRRARRRRGITWAVACAAVVFVVTSGFMAQKEVLLRKRLTELENWQREGALAELVGMTEELRAKQAAGRFDVTVGTHFVRMREAADRDQLRDVLQRHEEYLPPQYGIRIDIAEFITFPEEGWPLSLSYSPQRKLNKVYFQYQWHSLAKVLAASWGIPVPMQLRLFEDESLSIQYLHLMGGDIKSVDLDAPLYEGFVFVNKRELDRLGLQFLDQFPSDWESLPGRKSDEELLVVPRWSLPVWKFSSTGGSAEQSAYFSVGGATDGSGYTALFVAQHLIDNPESLFTPQTVEVLLEHVAATRPRTVTEVRAARGERLGQDLVALFYLQRTMIGLPVLFDALANYPDERDSKAVAQQVNQDVDSAVFRLPSRLRGPWGETPTCAVQDNSSNGQASVIIHHAYRETEHWLLSAKKSVRVYVGQEIEEEWFTGDKQSDALRKVTESLQDLLYRQYGIDAPEVAYRDHTWNMTPAQAFRIFVLNQAENPEDVKPIPPATGQTLNVFAHELRKCLESLRTYWITPDMVSGIVDRLDTNLKTWITKRYSITDIKALLRGVVNPTQEELDERLVAEDRELVPVKPECTVRYAPWLVGSLVFWTLVEDRMDANALVVRLRETQRARLEMSSERAEDPRTAQAIARGSGALAEDRIEDASNIFREVLERDREGAIGEFLAIWPAQLEPQLRAFFEQKAEKLENPDLTRTQRVDLEDLIAGMNANTDSETKRRFELLLAGAAGLGDKQRADLLNRLLNNYGEPDEWPGDEARILAEKALYTYDPLRDDPRMLERTSAFLKCVFSRLDEKDAFDFYWKIIDLAYKRNEANWCWRLLKELADLKADGLTYSIPLELASQLTGRERRADLKYALALLDREEKKFAVADLSSEDRRLKLATVRWLRARALEGLAQFDEPSLADEAEKILVELLTSEYEGIRERAYVELAQMRLNAGRLWEADAVLEPALTNWPHNFQLHNIWLLTKLLEGDREAVASTAREVIDKVESATSQAEYSQAWFVVALGQITTQTGPWPLTARYFIKMDHEYRDYIAAMLFAFSDGESRTDARNVLTRRWSEISQGRSLPEVQRLWKARLGCGDTMVRREMLIGYYLDKLTEAEIFEDIEDEERYAASSLRELPFPRQGLLCETYFYDALLARARDDKNRMRERLERVVSTKHMSYLEYHLAKYLLEVER